MISDIFLPVPTKIMSWRGGDILPADIYTLFGRTNTSPTMWIADAPADLICPADIPGHRNDESRGIIHRRCDYASLSRRFSTLIPKLVGRRSKSELAQPSPHSLRIFFHLWFGVDGFIPPSHGAVEECISTRNIRLVRLARPADQILQGSFLAICVSSGSTGGCKKYAIPRLARTLQRCILFAPC